MGLLPGLFAAAAALAALYGLLWARPDAPPGWPRSLTKTGSVAGLALAAWVAGAPGLIVAGLALGAAGDFALSRPGSGAFLAGMAAFAAGHLAYALGFATAPLLALAGPEGGALHISGTGAAALALLALLLGSTELWLSPHTGAFKAPVRGYVVVIGLMAAASLLAPGTGMVGLTESLGMHNTMLLLPGVALFVLSDLMLALERFVLGNPAARALLARALWPAYWLGQALILAGSLADPGQWWLIGKG